MLELLPPKLLVVEDDKDDLESLMRVLRQVDFQVSIAMRGDDAKRLLMQHSYHAVLLNLSLPDMDGLELVRWCQEHWPSLPLFIITGQDHPETRLHVFQAGAISIFAK